MGGGVAERLARGEHATLVRLVIRDGGLDWDEAEDLAAAIWERAYRAERRGRTIRPAYLNRMRRNALIDRSRRLRAFGGARRMLSLERDLAGAG